MFCRTRDLRAAGTGWVSAATSNVSVSRTGSSCADAAGSEVGVSRSPRSPDAAARAGASPTSQRSGAAGAAGTQRRSAGDDGEADSRGTARRAPARQARRGRRGRQWQGGRNENGREWLRRRGGRRGRGGGWRGGLATGRGAEAHDRGHLGLVDLAGRDQHGDPRRRGLGDQAPERRPLRLVETLVGGVDRDDLRWPSRARIRPRTCFSYGLSMNHAPRDPARATATARRAAVR